MTSLPPDVPAGGPLTGIRVLELAANLSGPWGTMLLGDQGADVIKIEPPEGDRMRNAGHYRQGVPGLGTVFLGANRNKRSVVLDLKTPAHADVARRIAAQCDVVVQNYRPGVVERLGLGYEDLRKLRSDIIYVSIDGLGAVGPDARRRVYDPVIQGIAGFAGVQSDRETGEPRMVQTAVVDKVVGLQVCQGATAALFHRERTGQGQHVRVSMLKAGIAFLWPDAMGAATLIGEDVVASASVSTVRYVFPTLDDFVIVSNVSDAEWRALCLAIERGDLIADPRFLTQRDRGQNRPAMNNELSGAFRHRTTSDWLEVLRRFDANYAPVNRPARVHQDPAVIALKIVEEREHPLAGAYRQPAHGIDFERTPARFRRHPPSLNQHYREVLDEFGCRLLARSRRPSRPDRRGTT